MRKILLSTVLALMAAPVWAEMPKASITLLSGWRMENGNHMAALHVVLDPGWKTYWRAPGDGGIPPELDWTGSENLATVAYHWPVPEVLDVSGMTTIGYREELLLPIEVTPDVAGEDVTLSAELLLGICEQICVPVNETLDATLPADGTDPDPAILRALERRPDTEDEAGVASVACEVEDTSDGVRVHAVLDLPQIAPGETVVYETKDADVWVSEAIGGRDETGTIAVYADLVAPDGLPFDVEAADMRFTVLGAGRGVDVRGCDTIADAD